MLLKRAPKKSSKYTNKKPLATWNELQGCQPTSRAKPFLRGGDQARAISPSCRALVMLCTVWGPRLKARKAARADSPPTSTLFRRFLLPLSMCPRGGQGLELAAPPASKLEKSRGNISSCNSSPRKTPSCELFPETRPCKHGGSARINISRTVIPAVITAFAQTFFFFFFSHPAR